MPRRFVLESPFTVRPAERLLRRRALVAALRLAAVFLLLAVLWTFL